MSLALGELLDIAVIPWPSVSLTGAERSEMLSAEWGY